MKKILATILAAALGLGAWAVDPVTIKDADGADISVYEVSSGFYQNGATYDNTTDFYITSKDGLKYFRDWVNGTSAAMNHYYDSGFLTLTLASFATSNGMAGKKVHLLADIDLTGEVWQPIGPNSGSVPDKFASNWKAHFYGSFYGHGHVISNIDTSASDQGDKYSRWPQGFFGSIASGGPIDGLILENVKAVSNFAGGYAGAIVGDLGALAYTISNCKVMGKIEIKGGYTGAICGIGSANIVNCVVSGDDGSTITGVYFAGGLVGAERAGSGTSLTISDNSVSGVAITSSQYVGGLVGAMASGAAGTCSITENSLSDVTVNDDAVTADSLIASNSDATAPVTEVDNTVSVSSQPVTNSVQSVNLFGAIKVVNNASNMFVALPFEGFEATGAARKAGEAVHPANLADGTMMYVYDAASGKYDAFVASSGAWAAPAAKVTVGADGTEVEPPPDAERGLSAGSGAIVDRKSMDAAVYVYGQVPSASSLSIAPGTSLVCAPSTNALAEVDLNSLAWTGVTASGCNAAGTRLKSADIQDFIRFRGPDNKMVNYYYFGGKWGAEYRPSSWDGKARVPAGTAFWYTAKAAVTMSW